MFILALVVFAIALAVIAVPVMIAARIVGAGRNGFWICLLAAIVSSLIVGLAVRVFHGGGLLSFFVAPVGYMWILGTTYLRGLLMVLLQYLMAAVIVAVLMFTALGALLPKELLHGLPVTNTPSQSV